jgi:hypothetical protein
MVVVAECPRFHGGVLLHVLAHPESQFVVFADVLAGLW